MTPASPTGTRDDPWPLHTAPGTSAYTMYRDPDLNFSPTTPGELTRLEVAPIG